MCIAVSLHVYSCFVADKCMRIWLVHILRTSIQIIVRNIFLFVSTVINILAVCFLL